MASYDVASGIYRALLRGVTERHAARRLGFNARRRAFTAWHKRRQTTFSTADTFHRRFLKRIDRRVKHDAFDAWLGEYSEAGTSTRPLLSAT